MQSIQHKVGADPSHLHNVIDNALPPILTVEPGEVVRFACPAPPLPRDATRDDVARIDLAHPHVVVGPVRVAGAEPGDVLVVDILEIELAQDYGHCVVLPGFGLLAERFGEAHIHNFRFDADGTSLLCPGVRIPLRPFCGIVGCAPAEPGTHPTVPPRRVGGNVDIARLTAGTRVFLPVEVDGALFSCGDGHAAQGAGEVCGTALETALDVTLRIDVRRDLRFDHPAFQTAPDSRRPEPAGAFAVTSTGPDLYACAERAVGAMVDWLHEERGLAEIDAYVLASCAVDLTIEEIVDRPHWLVSASLPLDVFEDGAHG